MPMKHDMARKPASHVAMLLVALVVAVAGVLMLAGCGSDDGSKDILGTWQAQDAKGGSVVIAIEPKLLRIGNKSYSCKQNITGDAIYNSAFPDNKTMVRDNTRIYYYGLTLSNGDIYTVVFPEKDRSIALLLDSKSASADDILEGTFLYAMHRDSAPSYQAYQKKYIKSAE